MTTQQLITVWGSGGAGKTTFALKLALALAAEKQSVTLISADETTPALPLLMPLAKRPQRSLGQLWRTLDFSQEDVLKQCVPFCHSPHLAILGYDENDLTGSHTAEMAADLFLLLRQVTDHIIVDCATNFSANPLSTLALRAGDIVFKLLNPDPKSLLQLKRFKSHGPALENWFQHRNVLNNVYDWQEAKTFYDGIGEIAYQLPHCPSLYEQLCHGALDETLTGRHSREYRQIMADIAEEVMGFE